MATKHIAAEVKAVDSSDPNGEFEVILSAPTLDRDGEIVDAKCFEPLPEHITFDIDHGLSIATTVGSGRPYYDGDLLKVKGTFSSIPRAQEVRTLVTEGHIRSTSVAFRDSKKELKDGVPHITKGELLNGAFVPVPANRDTAVLSAKAGARNSSADLERIQAMHDSTVALGADCGPAKTVRRVATKTAVDGSYEERQEELREAIAEANADQLRSTDHNDYRWLEIVATFDDHAVYCIHTDNNDDNTFSVTYTWDGDEVTLGDTTPVEVSEVVTVSDETTATRSAKPGRKDATGASDDEAELQLRARALRLLQQTVTA